MRKILSFVEFITHLLQGAEEGLESGKVPDQLEDSQDPGDADQTKDLSGLADDVELRQVINQERYEVGQDSEQVDLGSPKGSLVDVQEDIHMVHLTSSSLTGLDSSKQ